MIDVSALFEQIGQLFVLVWAFVSGVTVVIVQMSRLLLPALPGGLWCAWWLWCANWKEIWPILHKGAWVAVVLLMVVSALAWSQIFPRGCNCLGVTIPNFWWQLGSVGTLTVVALFCGWLQEQCGLTPIAISFDPPSKEPVRASR
jgi:hypothetical protein